MMRVERRRALIHPAQPDLRVAVPRVRMVDNIVADGAGGAAEGRQPVDGRPQPVGS